MSNNIIMKFFESVFDGEQCVLVLVSVHKQQRM